LDEQQGQQGQPGGAERMGCQWFFSFQSLGFLGESILFKLQGREVNVALFKCLINSASKPVFAHHRR
jgi:hypothetical protein